jgi:hypothetical protein
MKFPSLITRSTVITLLVLAVICLIGGLIAWQVLPVIAAFTCLPRLSSNIASEGGLNYWLALPVAIGFIGTAFVGIKMIFRSGTRNKISKFVLLVLALTCIYSLSIFGLQQYKAQRKTVAIAETVAKMDDDLSTFKKLKVTPSTAYFDRVTKKPTAFYFKHPNGQLDIFSSPGVHPQLGVELKPMDSLTAEYISDLFRRGLADQMINSERVIATPSTEAPTKARAASTSKKTHSAQHSEIAKESSLQALTRQTKEQYERLASLITPEAQVSSKKGGN